MKKISALLLASLCAASLLTGCSGKDGDPGPTGPAGPNLTGALVGFVNPVDQYGDLLAKSGVTVTLDGVTPALTTTTNADGRYEFANVRNGTYNFTFSRTGLASTRRIGVGHIGGDQPTFLGTSFVSEPSTTVVGNVSVDRIRNDIELDIPFSNSGAPEDAFLDFVVYASSSPGTTAANGVFLASPYGYLGFSNSTEARISKSRLNASGFASGTRVYAVVYGAPRYRNSYTDPSTGRVVYSGLSATPSNQVSFIVP